MSKSRPGTWALLGLVVAIIGIIAPIAWDRYKARSSIELRYLSSLSLIEGSGSLPKLELRYDGKVISGVSRLVFGLVNTGRTPILQKDLISPPTITFEHDTTLLDVERGGTNPPDLEWSYRRIDAGPSIQLDFPLLNPGDSLQFAVLVGGRAPKYEVKARIVGINNLAVVDRTKELEKGKAPLSWTVYVVGATSGLFLLMLLVAGLPELLEERRVKRGLKSRSLAIPRNKLPEEYKTFIKATYSRKTAKERAFLARFFENLPEDQPINDQLQTAFEEALTQYASQQSVAGAVTVITVIVCAGIAYVVMKVYAA